MRTNRFARVASLALTLTACASTPRRTEPTTAARVDDSAPDRRAALQSATPGLDVEEQRWGIEAAKQRKRDRQQQAQTPPALHTATDLQVVDPSRTTP